MSEPSCSPAVFTPDNEPYLGLPTLVAFDQAIVWALEGNGNVAAWTHAHSDELSSLQLAACQIIPQGINIALSIRELVRQGYLFPAMVLMRPLIERAAVISYLCGNPQAVALWHAGWKHSQRPSLRTMLRTMGGPACDPDAASKVCEAHNHIVHGDPVASYYNLIHLGDGRPAYASSKMLDSPDAAAAIAAEALCYLVVVAARMTHVFPEAAVPARSGDGDIGDTDG